MRWRIVARELAVLWGVVCLVASALFIGGTLAFDSHVEPDAALRFVEALLCLWGMAAGIYLFVARSRVLVGELRTTRPGRGVSRALRRFRRWSPTTYRVVKWGALLLTFYLASTWALRAILRTDTPFMAVESNSMQPAFSRGDLLVIKGVAPTGVAAGDVIVYRAPEHGIDIVHRVVDVVYAPDGGVAHFVTKGDANPGRDPWDVEPEWVRGRVVGVIPWLGNLSLWLREK